MVKQIPIRSMWLVATLPFFAWCAASWAAPDEVENPYKNAKVGDWAKYRYARRPPPSGSHTMTRTVVAKEGETVRIKESVVWDSGMKSDESEKTINLRQPFTLKERLYYKADSDVRIVERRRETEILQVGERKLKANRISYDIDPGKFDSAQREIWTAAGVPLDGVLKVRTVRNHLVWVQEMVAFGFAGELAPEKAPTAEVSRKAETKENSLGQVLVFIPKGQFLMGAIPLREFNVKALPLNRVEKLDLIGRLPPQHPEVIQKGFWMSAHEVTVGQFRQFVKATGYKTDAEKSGLGGTGLLPNGKWGQDPRFTWEDCGFPLTDKHPVVNVSWNDGKAFCGWLSKKEGKRYRLPTEAEWEYACRAGTTTAYNTGEDAASLDGHANMADRSLKKKEPTMRWALQHDDGYPYLAPVGSFKANAFGLFDMHGNALEWCGDGFNFADPLKPHVKFGDKTPDPPNAPVRYVLRGGNWFNDPARATSASRTGAPPDHRMSLIGFRIVMEAEKAPR